MKPETKTKKRLRTASCTTKITSSPIVEKAIATKQAQSAMGLFGLRTFILCKKIHKLATDEGKHDMIRKEREFGSDSI
ncbi:hypothetical protein M2298_002014 [Brevibacillus sp. 1238]|uniref:Uncharacterized protein n=1 Tax=Brevibacillus parabrevis TaxID=54914 RepID=A0A4Y3P8X4_BREPA|nr:hypothetical protein [Brevibacillus sp. 1238]GEB30842.1 hypothetical protein BPA01_04220 [Brevibacillus parabrevis]